MNFLNDLVVPGEDLLDPGLEPSVGPRHDVPVAVPHHLLDLLAQGRRIIVRGCGNTRLRNATYKIVQRTEIWRPWALDLLLLSL